MSGRFAGVVFGLVVLAAVFTPVERLFPAVPGRRWRRRGLLTDVLYWFVTAVLTKAVARGAVVLVVIGFAVASGVRPDATAIQAFVASPGALVQRQPTWLQVLEVLLIGDLVGYWVHRAFHRGRLWRVHAVHHSSIDLDWLSAVRLHPINDVLARIAQVVPVLVLGFPPAVLAAYVPFLGFYAIAIHANVPWTLGPLRFLIASPTFHRWHHALPEELAESGARTAGVNFAGLFPFLDLVFGTFHLPPGRVPRRFGAGEPVPESLAGQLAFPFRRPARAVR